MLAVGATAAAVKVHDFFEGETLLRDLVDEAVRAERITFRDRIFTPSVTLWAFLA